ncbi:two-component sensor histidine kinase [Paucibacter sp. TC2R-5]|uniref:cache domain-containing sensor histidine kinase n=1 Tax=Paucibacter sp. TC2R-5 TaxID=2893555 RepID=UPI0021E364E3|nr:ATP-binding protein [Paucibacter sp. TC2R-5]MCV2359185.1 two-component sensor histidine kinase [Paucibacter sp. TC2R-5]
MRQADPAAASRPEGQGPEAGTKLRRVIIGGCVLGLILAWTIVIALLLVLRRGELDNEIKANTNLARVFDAQTERLLATIDQATIRWRDQVAVGKASSEDLIRYANETGLAPKILVQLAWVNEAGRPLASNLDPDGSKGAAVNLSDREHIKIHLPKQTPPEVPRLADPDQLFIGKPVLGKVSNKWTIQLSRRIIAADGSFLGVVVASLDPAYLEEVYRRVDLGSAGAMTLIGADLNIRARVIGGVSAKPGATLDASSAFAREGLGKPESLFMGVGSVDGTNRIIASRQISNYPLYLLVATGLDEALNEWRHFRNAALGLTLLLSAAIIGAAATLLTGLRRQHDSMAALRASEAKAQAANQTKSEFLAAMSHELRTPLTSIRGFAELMEQRLEDPKFRKQAGLIRKGAEHLNTLLTEILDLSKVEAGGLKLALEEHELRPLVQGCADFFTLSASNKGLAMEVRVDENAPSHLRCDGLRLKQILNNLLSNAIKFTASGAVTLSVERISDGLLAFHIDDTGPGIPLAVQEHIFEKFRQANAQISSEHGGTGLGLALSRGLAEAMHGSLVVKSELGHGARFTLTVPLLSA